MKVLIGSVIVAIILIMSSCIFVAGTHKHEPHCPVCDEHDPTEEHLNSHAVKTWDGEPYGVEGYCACNCCGVYIIDDPDIITEHLKTCCP